jgi:hypothetical protein
MHQRYTDNNMPLRRIFLTTVILCWPMQLFASPYAAGFYRSGDGVFQAPGGARFDSGGAKWPGGRLGFEKPLRGVAASGVEAIQEEWRDFAQDLDHPKLSTRALYRRVRYDSVWQGVAVEFYAAQNRIEFDVIVQPDAAFESAVFAAAEADFTIDSEGALRDHGVLFAQPPEVPARNARVRYRLVDAHRFGFAVEGWDRKTELRIDPVLALNVFINISGDDYLGVSTAAGYGWLGTYPPYSGALLVNSSGNLVIAAQANGVSGYHMDWLQGVRSAGVLAVRSPSSVVGAGFGSVSIVALAQHPAGGYVIAGTEGGVNLPVSPGAYQPSSPAAARGFVAWISADLKKINFSAALETAVSGLMVLPQGDIVVTGFSYNLAPYTTGAYRSPELAGANPNWQHASVVRLKGDGSALVWASLVGGDGQDSAYVCTLDKAGNILVAGSTSSKNLHWPNAALQSGYAPSGSDPLFPYNDGDGFVLRLSPDGARLVNGTYFGSSRSDVVTGIFTTGDGSVLITGLATASDFPVTSWFPGPPAARTFGSHGFTALLRTDLGALTWSTAFPGGAVMSSSLAPDQSLYASLAAASIPATEDAYQSRGDSDARLISVDARSGRVIYSASSGYSGGSFYPLVAAGPSGQVATASSTAVSDLPYVAAGNIEFVANIYRAVSVQSYQFGDASPAPAAVVIRAMTPNSPAATGTVKISGQKNPVTVATIPAGLPPWLSFPVSSANQGESLTWRVSAAGLAPGNYTYSAPLRTSGGTLQPSAVVFNLWVDALAAQPSRLDAGTISRSMTSADISLRVKAQYGLAFTATSDQPWLTVPANTKIAPCDLLLLVLTAGMSPGDYTATITLTPGSATSDAVRVPVVVHII